MLPLRAPHRPIAVAVALTVLAPACRDSMLNADRAPAAHAANPIAGAAFYVDAASAARRQADAWRSHRPADAALMDRIASQPQAVWFGEWSGDVRRAVGAAVAAAERTGAVPVLVAYNVPQRDCGGLSGGGGATPEAYRRWVSEFAAGIGGSRAVVVVEPDALAMLDCLTAADGSTRLELLRHAVAVLARTGAAVYLDAGHARWHPAAEAADRLRRAGVEHAAGFSLNVSNFVATEENARYADELSRLLGGGGAVIDTSRNGLGAAPDEEWCNPPGRALGAAPTTATGRASVHAYLWIKRPGESDGACNGGPPAGEWWGEYALGLARRAPA